MARNLLSPRHLLRPETNMRPTRRLLLATGLAAPFSAFVTRAGAAERRWPTATAATARDAGHDQTAALQAAIDSAARRGSAFQLPAGTFPTRTLVLPPGCALIGAQRLTRLVQIGPGPVLQARVAGGIVVRDLTIEGGGDRLATAGRGLVDLEDCAGFDLDGVAVARAGGRAIAVRGGSGRIRGCTIRDVGDAAIATLDATVAITGNTITGCGNNGVLVWRSQPAEDGSRVQDNTIAEVRTDGGGSGQNGNGINVFRAGGVMVTGNRITGCAYSAVRANAASNVQIAANQCRRIGEVAIYAEFGFEGALIANNLVDGAAAGISVTNFNDGGRLAVVQGNLIRNLKRREHEPVDKRGEGISVEADTLVSANTIENAPTCGIRLGTGRYMRDVSATGNVIRGCGVGIVVSADAGAGSALIANNLISNSTDGAIRAHDHGRAVGPELARATPTAGRIAITGNTVG